MTTMTRAPRRAATPPAPACAAEPDRMFPVDESELPGERTPGERRALAVCQRCPVLAVCRPAVLGLDGTPPLAYGVAGGMTREDRRAIRAASRHLPREVAAPPDCRGAGSGRPRGAGCGVSETTQGPLAAAVLAQRLAEAARATASRSTAVGRCSAPVAVDPWGAVSERCPLPLGHGDEHEIESDFGHRERLARAAATHPGLVLTATGVVVAWLAGTGGQDVERPLPVRELWTLVDVAEAMASLGPPAKSATAEPTGVASDG